MRKADLVSIGQAADFQVRCREIAAEFGYSHKFFQSADDFVDEKGLEVTCVVISAVDVSRQSDIAGLVQAIRQTAKEAYLVVCIDSRVGPEVAVFIKKSGANAVILASEVSDSSKLEFILSQKIKSSYLPVKVSELTPNTQMECSLFHLLPLNRKFLPVFHAGQEIKEDRIQKLQEYSEVYLRREDLPLYLKYVHAQPDQSSLSLSRRCRAQFLSLMKSYIDLVMLIGDQSEYASFEEGKRLYLECETMSENLLISLGAVGEAWDVINNSAVGSYGSLERSPALAAYCGLLSLFSGFSDHRKVMVAALIADLGMMDLHPRVSRQLRKGVPWEQMHAEDQLDYTKHPVASLNRALSRKLQIPDDVKNFIICSHERFDEKGFPNRPRAAKVPHEAMLIQLSEMIDQKSLIRIGQERPKIQKVRADIFQAELSQGGRFSGAFLERIRLPMTGLSVLDQTP
jgi:hypothetical protein